MFDIGFWELFILFGIGLIVLGPERLPRVAMKVGSWAGQARRTARSLTTQLRQLDQFGSLTDGQIQQLSQAASFETYGTSDWYTNLRRAKADPSVKFKEETIVNAGDYAEDLILVLGGRVASELVQDRDAEILVARMLFAKARDGEDPHERQPVPKETKPGHARDPIASRGRDPVEGHRPSRPRPRSTKPSARRLPPSRPRPSGSRGRAPS